MVAICPSSIQRGIKKFIQSIKCYFFRCVFVLPFKIDMRLVSSICCSLVYYRVFKLLLLNIIQFNTRKVFKCFLAVCYIYCTLCFQSCRELVGQLVICYFFAILCHFNSSPFVTNYRGNKRTRQIVQKGIYKTFKLPHRIRCRTTERKKCTFLSAENMGPKK